MIQALRVVALVGALVVPTVTTVSWVGSAEDRLAAEEAALAAEAEAGATVVPTAAAANEEYCSPQLKRILRRVLKSCGLLGEGGESSRGCRPVDAKQVAQMSGQDFNALFAPMRERGGIVQFEQGEAELDDGDQALIDRLFADQRGASYFFIVARASPEGSSSFNTELSKARAEALMSHLHESFQDPDLEKEVGLLWLGEEFAQLDDQFCTWERSGAGEECRADDLNRSAFAAWIDCRL